MPMGVTDRAADCWELLIAIADLAGGEWAARARQVATFVVAGRVAEDSSTGVQLLADIRAVMDGHDRMASAVLAAKLNALDESGWGGWHGGKGMGARDLARRLKPYGIRPTTIRVEEATPKGYMADDFSDAFARYLRVPANKGNKRNKGNTNSDHVADVALVADIGETYDQDVDRLEDEPEPLPAHELDKIYAGGHDAEQSA